VCRTADDEQIDVAADHHGRRAHLDDVDVRVAGQAVRDRLGDAARIAEYRLEHHQRAHDRSTLSVRKPVN
jgi:hypothetical protein